MDVEMPLEDPYFYLAISEIEIQKNGKKVGHIKGLRVTKTRVVRCSYCGHAKPECSCGAEDYR